MMGNFGESWTEWATASPLRWLTVPAAVTLDAGQSAYNWATGTGVASAPPATAPSDSIDVPGTTFTDEDFAPFYKQEAEQRMAALQQWQASQRGAQQQSATAPARTQTATVIPLVIAGGVGLTLLLAAISRRR